MLITYLLMENLKNETKKKHGKTVSPNLQRSSSAEEKTKNRSVTCLLQDLHREKKRTVLKTNLRVELTKTDPTH